MAHQRVVLAAILGVLAVSLGCAAAPLDRPLPTTKIKKGPDSLEATRRAFEGTWTLASFDVIDAKGARRSIKATGQLTYDAFGSMSIRGVIEDAALRDTLVIDYQGRIVIDRVRSEFYPADLVSDRPAEADQIVPVSPDKVRRYEFSGNTLVVTYLDASAKPTAVTRWRRASSK